MLCCQNFSSRRRNPKAQTEWRAKDRPRSLDVGDGWLEDFPIDRSVAAVSTFTAGAAAAGKILTNFLRARLSGYATNRNKPELAGTSKLSPYLHFGQISPHTVALAVREAEVPAADRKAFLEELIVRRKLAINFVRHNPDYDSFDASEPWADPLAARACQGRAEVLLYRATIGERRNA